MAASKPSNGRKAKKSSSLGGGKSKSPNSLGGSKAKSLSKRKPKKPTSLGGARAKRPKKPERNDVGMHVILMTAMFLFLALFSAYSLGSTEPAVVGKVTAQVYTTTTSTSTTTTSSTSTIPTTTTSTIPTTTTTLCGGEYQPPCEDGCNLGFIVGSTGTCHPKGPCAPSVPSGRDGCGSFALSFCAGGRI